MTHETTDSPPTLLGRAFTAHPPRCLHTAADAGINAHTDTHATSHRHSHARADTHALPNTDAGLPRPRGL